MADQSFGIERATVNQQWEEYRQLAIPAEVPAAGLILLRRAFFAGALTHARILYLISGVEPEEKSFAMLEFLQDELRLFGEAIEKGQV